MNLTELVRSFCFFLMSILHNTSRERNYGMSLLVFPVPEPIKRAPHQTNRNRNPKSFARLATMRVESERLMRESAYKCFFDYSYLYQAIRECNLSGKTFHEPLRFAVQHKKIGAETAILLDTYVETTKYCEPAGGKAGTRKEKLVSCPTNLNYIRNYFFKTYEKRELSDLCIALFNGALLIFGANHEPLPWSDLQREVSFEVIRLLNYYDQPFVLRTGSDLVAHDRYIDILKKGKGSVRFCWTQQRGDDNQTVCNVSARRRRTAIEKLRNNAIKIDLDIASPSYLLA